MWRRFTGNNSGNFAVLSALSILPLVLAIGFGIDGSRYYAARSNLQDTVDTAALALAASDEQDVDKLRALAETFIGANIATETVKNVRITSLEASSENVTLGLDGDIQTTFMKLANVETMPVRSSALALRAPPRNVEVSMVLDNTWSMSETDSNGVAKIDTLKKAASDLVGQLLTGKDDMVSIGLVPYAENVNVGLQNRSASWLSVPADYVDDRSTPKVCTTVTEKSVCVAKEPTYACTKVTDGVQTQGTCGGGCTKYETQTVAPYQTCTGGSDVRTYKWYGCIGSRMSGTTRLNDGTASVRYPGYVETSAKCLNPIIPLTKDKTTLVNAIKGMIINIGSYKPSTYIPAGMIWGQNQLSPTLPLDEGAAYDPNNLNPRKILILMTDGDNTMRFVADTGKHVESTNATELTKTNNDTQSICTYVKSNKIELFTIAFMVTNQVAKTLLQNCATDSAHYFDATSSDKLLAAFSGIARSISQVRLLH